MKRFMGMMPSNEVLIEKVYKDSSGLVTIIQSGNHGWTILYADGSFEYDDVDNSPEENLNTALNVLTSYFDNLEEVAR